MAPPKKKSRKNSKPLESLEEKTDEILDCVAGPSSRDGSFVLDAGAGPSKEFTSSSVDISPSSPNDRGKKSFKKLFVRCSVNLPINDDCSELTEDCSGVEDRAKEKSKTKDRLFAESEDAENSIVKAMTPEEMKKHITLCLQLSSENKITTKNAFDLKLIDCMPNISKNSSVNNFAEIAYKHLEAGTDIYSHRVDALYEQGLSLARSLNGPDKFQGKSKVKVEPIKYVARPNRVNMLILKEVMYSILIECCSGKEKIENCEPGCVTFGHLWKRVSASPDLDKATREVLSWNMAFRAFMVLITEHRLDVQKLSDDISDMIISFPKDGPPKVE